MSETWSNDGYDPDFVERNGAWLLSVLGIFSACVSGMLVYFLKSRCVHIKCCGFECTRDVLDLSSVPEGALDIEVTRRPLVTRAIAALRRPPQEHTVHNSDTGV